MLSASVFGGVGGLYQFVDAIPHASIFGFVGCQTCPWQFRHHVVTCSLSPAIENTNCEGPTPWSPHFTQVWVPSRISRRASARAASTSKEGQGVSVLSAGVASHQVFCASCGAQRGDGGPT